jgi:DNA polymerase-3 subunit delta
MKISGQTIERFLAAPDPAVRVVLVYGPDTGLVQERTVQLVRGAAGDAADPFRVTELTAEVLQQDPARLADEAAALSLTGGRRAVRLRGAGDGLTGLLDDFLKALPGEALVVMEAGDLPPRSRLRRLLEGAKAGAALPCYRDEGRALAALIDEVLAKAGLRATADARAYLTGNLGGDRQLTRRELEKLIDYMGPGEPGREVGLADARACVGDSAALSLDDVAYAVAGGDLAGFERALARCLQEGASWVAPLRATARHLERLHSVAGAMASGSDAEAAMKRLRPPVFWKAQARFRGQAEAWSPAALAAAMARLLEAERRGKRGTAPPETLAARALFTVASEAQRRPART